MLKNPRFLYPKVPPIGEVLVLDEEQSAHCARVLRITAGESVSIIDGKGVLAEGEVLESHPKHVKIRLKTFKQEERKNQIEIIFGLAKPQALEWIFKKCTEMGVYSFQPLITDHSMHPSSWNAERWNKIVEEACKQCQELWFPEIRKPMSFRDWIQQRSHQSPFFLCDEEIRKADSEVSKFHPKEIVIGPEGGWSEQERELIKKFPVQHLGLGPNRLRAETACLVALTLVKVRHGEL